MTRSRREQVRRANMREIVLKHTKAERRILPFVPVIELADGVSEKHAVIFKNGETDRKKLRWKHRSQKSFRLPNKLLCLRHQRLRQREEVKRYRLPRKSRHKLQKVRQRLRRLRLRPRKKRQRPRRKPPRQRQKQLQKPHRRRLRRQKRRHRLL